MRPRERQAAIVGYMKMAEEAEAAQKARPKEDPRQRWRGRQKERQPQLFPVQERHVQPRPTVALPLDPDMVPLGLRKFPHAARILAALKDQS
jgi:hypothetical protein